MTTRRERSRTGVTLIELIVVIAILGIMMGVSIVAGGGGMHPTPTGTDRLPEERHSAIALGDQRTILMHDSAGARLITLLPDGRIIGGDTRTTDPMSGRPRHASH
jgi:prepilin-type N-terminal cleavage/methylation domain-containing protein